MLSDEAIPRGLTALDHEVLTDFLHGTSTLPDLLKKRGLSGGGVGGASDFLAWLESPAVAAAIEEWEYLHELHFQAQLTRLRRAALDVLHEVAAATPNLTEKRKAATTVITHIDRLFRAHPHLSRPVGWWPRHLPPPCSPTGELSPEPRPRRRVTEGAFSSTPATSSRPCSGATSNGDHSSGHSCSSPHHPVTSQSRRGDPSPHQISKGASSPTASTSPPARNDATSNNGATPHPFSAPKERAVVARGTASHRDASPWISSQRDLAPEGHASSTQLDSSHVDGPRTRGPQPERLGVNSRGSSDESSSRATPGSRSAIARDPEGVGVVRDHTNHDCHIRVHARLDSVLGTPSSALRRHSAASLAALAGVIPDTS